MLSKILKVGDKIELTKVTAIQDIVQDSERRVFVSQLLDIVDEERVKIGMPIEGGKIIPFSIGAKLDACFYTSNGLYQGRLLVTDRYKEENIFMLVVELTTDLKKYQRRQYYRLGCTIDIRYRILTKEEVDEFAENEEKEIVEDGYFKEGTALDISGGGMRFVSDTIHENNDEMIIILKVEYDDIEKKYGLLGKVMSSSRVRNRDNTFEHRIEYNNMKGGTREALIKYIFQEERKQRHREKG